MGNNEQTVDKQKEPLMVTIRCITYNHEPYIRQCLEGFVMQKTNFRFEAIVHDDASTDGTAAIVREYAEKYPEIIKPIFEVENQYSKHDGSLDRIMNEHTHGKYVALCEGDDYWTDSLKLQKQVDFLEENPEYGLVYNKVRVYLQEKGKMLNSEFGKFTRSYKHLIFENTIPTLTVCCRTEFVEKYFKEGIPSSNQWMLGDFPLWLYLASKTKIYFQDEIVGVYRKLECSASHSRSYKKQLDFIKSGVDVQIFYAKRYDNSLIHLVLLKYYIDSFYLLLLEEKYKECWRAIKVILGKCKIIYLPFMFMQIIFCQIPVLVCFIEKVKKKICGSLIVH